MAKLGWRENTHEGLKEKVGSPWNNPGWSAVGGHPSDPITGPTWGQGHISMCVCGRREHSGSCLNQGDGSQTTEGNNRCSSNKGWGSSYATTLRGDRLWFKWWDVYDHSGQSRGGWNCQERPLKRGSFTDRETKARMTDAVSSEAGQVRFASNAEREKNLSFLKICTQWNSFQKWRNKSFSDKQKLRGSNISMSLL